MALHHWIFDKDLYENTRKNLLISLVDSPRTIRKKAASAIGMVKSKLADRYLVDEIFMELEPWDKDENVTEGDYRYIDDVMYRALRDNSNKRPTSNPDDWIEDDPRDQTIVSCVVDITIWELFKSLGPDKRPESVQTDYEDRVEWLMDVRKGDESPDLPIKEDGTVIVRGGSDEQKEWTY